MKKVLLNGHKMNEVLAILKKAIQEELPQHFVVQCKNCTLSIVASNQLGHNKGTIEIALRNMNDSDFLLDEEYTIIPAFPLIAFPAFVTQFKELDEINFKEVWDAWDIIASHYSASQELKEPKENKLMKDMNLFDDEESNKESKLEKPEGWEEFKEETGNKNLVYYDPNEWEICYKRLADTHYLHYKGKGKIKNTPINISSCYRMFHECENLIELDLSNFDTSKVINMCGMFWGCKSLEELDLSNFDTSKVTNMHGVFCGCESLKELDLSSFDTSNVIYMSAMFEACGKLERLDLSNFDTSKVTNMDEMFTGCVSMKELNLSSFDTSNVTDMWEMFMHCRSLEKVDLSNFDTSKVDNMGYMFYECVKLKELDLSSFRSDNVTNIAGMFAVCNKLERLNLSNFDTEYVIGTEDMFSECFNLPQSIKDKIVNIQ